MGPTLLWPKFTPVRLAAFLSLSLSATANCFSRQGLAPLSTRFGSGTEPTLQRNTRCELAKVDLIQTIFGA